MRKDKHEIFKVQLMNVIDEFIIAVEKANRANGSAKRLEDPITYTFENFMKWILYKRNKKINTDLKRAETKNADPK